MKHFYLITLFFTFSIFLHAQLDTSFQRTTIVEEVFEQPQIVDEKSYLLNSLTDEKHAIRLGVEGTTLPDNYQEYYIYLPLANSLFLEYEYRVKTGFSINTQLHYNRVSFTTLSQTLILDLSVPVTHNYGFHIEPRWYLNKHRQINTKRSGDNFKGIYTSLIVGVRFLKSPDFEFYTDGKKQFLKSQYQYGTLNLGWQRRFGKYGFLHLQLGTGIQHIPQKNIKIGGPIFTFDFELKPLTKWQWINSYRIGVGLAINKQEDTVVKHSFWTYQKDDTDMWKIDLFGFLYSINKTGLGGKINVGYEKSIKQSAFSLNSNLLLIQQVLINSDIKFNQVSIQLAPRFYYNLKRRIRKGKTSNDLSADYLSIRNQWNIYKYSEEEWSKNYDFSIIWGTQRRIFKHVYVNYELGYDFPNRKYLTLRKIISELKIGLAF